MRRFIACFLAIQATAVAAQPPALGAGPCDDELSAFFSAAEARLLTARDSWRDEAQRRLSASGLSPQDQQDVAKGYAATLVTAQDDLSKIVSTPLFFRAVLYLPTYNATLCRNLEQVDDIVKAQADAYTDALNESLKILDQAIETTRAVKGDGATREPARD